MCMLDIASYSKLTDVMGFETFVTRPMPKRMTLDTTKAALLKRPIRSPLQLQSSPIRSPLQLQSSLIRSPLQLQSSLIRSPLQLQSSPIRSPLQLQSSLGGKQLLLRH